MRPESTPAPVLDTRIARSPVVALRFHLDAQAAELGDVIDDTERRLIEATTTRENLLRQLRRIEAQRSAVAGSVATALQASEDELSLVEELSRIEERVRHLKRTHHQLTTRRDTLRAVSAGVRDVAAPDVTFDEQAARFSRAARSMYQLLDAEHRELGSQILEGPMQRLAESCFEAELTEQAIAAGDDSAAVHAARCREHAAAASAELEALQLRLQPVSSRRGLVEAIRELLRQAGDGRRVTFRVIGIERRFSRFAEVALYRIVDEAVSNAVRHARASRLDLVLSFHPQRISLLVKDDGEGFDVAATEARLGRSGGLGIITMHEQASLVGSRLEVRSLIGAGTEVRAVLADSVS